jgi:hypothetical protein
MILVEKQLSAILATKPILMEFIYMKSGQNILAVTSQSGGYEILQKFGSEQQVLVTNSSG